MQCRATQFGQVMVGDFWQNVVDLRRERQATQHSCLWNTMNNMKRPKYKTLKDNTPPPPPRSGGIQCVTGKERRNNSRKNEEFEPKWIQCPLVDVSDGESKVWCCKEKYCIATCKIRSMNQSKQDVVKQNMAIMSIDILGIRGQNWTEMGKFNSYDGCIYYSRQNPLEEK